MTLGTGIAIYFLLWWLTLFAVLPFGIRSQSEEGKIVKGSDPGAPVISTVGRKLGWTTLVSATIFAVIFVLFATKLLDSGSVARFIGMQP
jgi:predicted secreted protein